MADTLCFLQALKERRSYYALSDKSPAEQAEIIQVIKEAVKYAPSAFNCQGTRAVVLFGERHLKVWQIVCETLQARVPADKFAPTAQKIASFSAAYGTVLFWEDWTAVEELQHKFPLYKENFPIWAYQANAMAELAVWSGLETLGLGASLQHYNPLIDEAVKREFGLPASWKLIAQMPFGQPTQAPLPKTFSPIEERVKVLG